MELNRLLNVSFFKKNTRYSAGEGKSIFEEQPTLGGSSSPIVDIILEAISRPQSTNALQLYWELNCFRQLLTSIFLPTPLSVSLGSRTHQDLGHLYSVHSILRLPSYFSYPFISVNSTPLIGYFLCYIFRWAFLLFLFFEELILLILFYGSGTWPSSR